MVIFYDLTNKALPEDQSAALASLVSHKGQAVVAHTFNPRAKGTDRSLLVQGHPGLQEMIQSKRETEPDGGEEGGDRGSLQPSEDAV